MVNRVFCYSKEEAQKNGNDLSTGMMIFQIFALVIVMVIMLIVLMFANDSFMENPMFLMIYMLVWIVVIMYYAINAGAKMRSKLIGFATDTNNNIYCAMKLNNGEEFAIGGLVSGNIIDNVVGDSASVLGDSVQVAGAAMALYSMDKSAKIMQNPEVISRMVECATTTTGAEVRQILKVYSCSESKHKVKVKCDYKIMRTGKVKSGKNITVYKSYNCFNELLSLLSLKK